MIDRLSTHVLDNALGRPASGIPVTVFCWSTEVAAQVGAGITDDNGRVASLVEGPLTPGRYQLKFDTTDWFEQHHGRAFYPCITLEVHLDGQQSHCHLPVLISTFSYTTYLGS